MRISKDIVTISIVGAGSRSTGYINALEKYYHGKFNSQSVGGASVRGDGRVCVRMRREGQ